MSLLAVPNPIELIRKNAKQRIDITIKNNDTGDSVNATELELQVTDLADAVLYSEDFFVAPSRIVKPAGTTGYYYIVWGDGGVTPPDPTGETDTPGDLLFNWRIVGQSGTEEVNITQVAKIVSASTLGLLPYLRLLIDKSLKQIDIEEGCRVGYTDDMLIQFLDGAIGLINKIQPGSVSFTLETFPITGYRILLLECALFVGLMSQALFSIDTDIDGYSDQGQSFNFQHFPKLMQFLNFLSQRLDKQIQNMKLTFVVSGAVLTEAGPSFRLQSLLTAAPSGASFRNLFYRT